jgi:hypothetical protein
VWGGGRRCRCWCVSALVCVRCRCINAYVRVWNTVQCLGCGSLPARLASAVHVVAGSMFWCAVGDVAHSEGGTRWDVCKTRQEVAIESCCVLPVTSPVVTIIADGTFFLKVNDYVPTLRTNTATWTRTGLHRAQPNLCTFLLNFPLFIVPEEVSFPTPPPTVPSNNASHHSHQRHAQPARQHHSRPAPRR